VERLAAHSRPSITVVEGLALGGGLELAMAATFRIAGDNALFTMPEVKLGLIPGAGGTQRVPRLVGRGNALRLMLLGNEISATEAAKMVWSTGLPITALRWTLRCLWPSSWRECQRQRWQQS
jgi:enoyl-CoA hydratase